MHFTLTAENDGTITVALGHDFTPADIPAVVAARWAATGRCSVCDHAAAVHDAVPADHPFTPAVTR